MTVVDLQTVPDLDDFLTTTHDPVLLYKHSATCGTSAFAREEIRHLVAEGPGPERVGMIVVQTARGVSNEVARRFAVRHESPQVLIVRDGKVVWTASHFRVTADAIRAALEAARRAAVAERPRARG